MTDFNPRSPSQLKKLEQIRFKDLQIHAAITVMPAQNSIPHIGYEPMEIAQFAVQLDAKFSPFTRQQFEIAFQGLKESCLNKARSYGLLRDGQ